MFFGGPAGGTRRRDPALSAAVFDVAARGGVGVAASAGAGSSLLSCSLLAPTVSLEVVAL